MKIENVKARKLKRGDQIVIGGVKHEIVSLTLHFGGKFKRVSITMRDPKTENNKTWSPCANLSVPASFTYTVYRKIKK